MYSTQTFHLNTLSPTRFGMDGRAVLLNIYNNVPVRE